MSHPTDFHALIEAAVRAPSGHNSQPWQFALGDDRITIAPDFSRRLSAVDPDNRELFISLGCALENLCLAAAHSGYAAQEHLADDGTVHIALHQQPEPTKQPENEALYAQIPRRQTNRATYNGSPIPQAQLDPILAAQQSDTVSLHAFAPSAPGFATLTQAVIAGNSAQMNNPAFKAELLSWIRFNQNHSNATRDGLSYAVIGAPNLPAWISRPIIRAMLNAKRQNMARHRAHPATHPARPHPARHRPYLPQPTLRSPRPTHPARPTARARRQTTTNPTAPRLRRRHALFTAQSSGQRYPNNTGSLKSIARQNNNDTNRAYSSATHTVCKISTTQARVRAYGTHPTRRLNRTFLDLLRHKIAQ